VRLLLAMVQGNRNIDALTALQQMDDLDKLVFIAKEIYQQRIRLK
jgi:hypothetical protein